jgi:methyltransferase
VVAAFWWLFTAVLAQRLVEVATAARTTRRLVAAGGRLVADDGYLLLVATHVLFLAGGAAEWAFAPWPSLGWWTYPGLAAFVAGELLRGWAMASLDGRWTTRIVVLPTAPLVAGGPYRFLRHPIYVGVTLMVGGFLLAFGLWATLAIVVPLHAVAVLRRIAREDAALAGLRHAATGDEAGGRQPTAREGNG